MQFTNRNILITTAIICIVSVLIVHQQYMTLGIICGALLCLYYYDIIGRFVLYIGMKITILIADFFARVGEVFFGRRKIKKKSVKMFSLVDHLVYNMKSWYEVRDPTKGNIKTIVYASTGQSFIINPFDSYNIKLNIVIDVVDDNDNIVMELPEVTPFADYGQPNDWHVDGTKFRVRHNKYGVLMSQITKLNRSDYNILKAKIMASNNTDHGFSI